MPRKLHYILTLIALLFLGVNITKPKLVSNDQQTCGTSGSAGSKHCQSFLFVTLEAGR